MCGKADERSRQMRLMKQRQSIFFDPAAIRTVNLTSSAKRACGIAILAAFSSSLGSKRSALGPHSGKKCQKKIRFDELRAGVDCWMGGRTVTAWLHMTLGPLRRLT